MNNQEIIKIVVVGEAGVGKTSLIKRYVSNFFSEDHKATVGVDFTVKNVNVNGKEVRLQLWDIAGQEKFGGSASKVYYRQALGGKPKEFIRFVCKILTIILGMLFRINQRC